MSALSKQLLCSWVNTIHLPTDYPRANDTFFGLICLVGPAGIGALRFVRPQTQQNIWYRGDFVRTLYPSS